MLLKVKMLRREKSFITNCFDFETIKNLNHIPLYETTSGISFLQSRFNTKWLYYFLVFPYEIVIPTGDKIATNIIYSGEQKNIFCKVLEKNGLFIKRKFIKMDREVKWISKDYAITYACIDEVENVMSLLLQSFHETFDKLIDRKNLERMIFEKQVLIIKIKNKIVGVLVFSIQGLLSRLEFICIDKDFKQMGLGKQLMQHYLNVVRVRKSELWVDSNNVKAIYFYEKLGYCKSGIYNEIFANYE
ncbi:GNAT family N-acetyltransferase [Helicobacter pullorum]|uniref:GNAT family N-acetyltransferase n=1 Tax=Helicobacter pullorum TaxID=35818 RepID=UPI00081682EE|nr:GNAT family N-acetyltransferase [Helicobacter pullorum]OCR10752.1 hypothetical protein A7X13_01630 [Helicobacter pullorum]